MASEIWWYFEYISNKYNISLKEGIQFPGNTDEDVSRFGKENEIVKGHTKGQPFET
jgi:hypothetical protein